MHHYGVFTVLPSIQPVFSPTLLQHCMPEGHLGYLPFLREAAHASQKRFRHFPLLIGGDLIAGLPGTARRRVSESSEPWAAVTGQPRQQSCGNVMARGAGVQASA